MTTAIQFSTFGSQLTDLEYAQYHILRKKASTMDSLQLQKFNSLISSNFSKEKKLTVLSVGSGKGDFDKDFIQLLASRINRYVCIEPLQEHLGPLKTNLLEVLPEDKIEMYHGLAEDFQTDQTFDIIHNIHVIHWTKDPIYLLKKLESYLAKGGLNITVLQSKEGMPRIYSQLKPDSQGSLTAETLFQDMMAKGMNLYHLDYIPAELDITTIINQEETGKKSYSS